MVCFHQYFIGFWHHLILYLRCQVRMNEKFEILTSEDSSFCCMENRFLFRAPPPSDDKPLTCPTTKTTSSKKKNIPVISIAESPAPLELKLLRANDGSLCLDALIYLIYPSFICFSIFILLCTSHCFTEFISVQFSKSLSTFFNISRSWEISRY